MKQEEIKRTSLSSGLRRVGFVRILHVLRRCLPVPMRTVRMHEIACLSSLVSDLAFLRAWEETIPLQACRWTLAVLTDLGSEE